MEKRVKLYMEKYGEGDKYLFIPGVVGTINYWKTNLEPYFHKGEFILVDPLGFGRSIKPNTSYTVDKHICALYETVKEEGPFTLVGHSMGSILALNFAKQHPDLVKRVILIGLPVFSSEKNAKTYFRKQMRGSITHVFPAAISCIFSRHILNSVSPLLKRKKNYSPMWSPTMIDEMQMHTWRSFTSSLWEVVYRGNVYELAEKLENRIPVTCLHGTDDKSAPFSYLQPLIEKQNSWEVFNLPGGDHHIFLHHTSWCMKYILQENIS